MNLQPLIWFLFCFLISCAAPWAEENSDNTFVRKPFDYSEIEDGDIIIKRGKGYVSNMIVKELEEAIPFSHCGIIIKETDSVYIIHSVAREVSHADGVQITDIPAFLDDSFDGSVYIVRVKNDSTHFSSNSISDTAKHYLRSGITFDYAFDYKNSDKMYCTELLHKTLKDVYHKDFFDKTFINNKQVLLFHSFLDTTNFKRIARY